MKPRLYPVFNFIIIYNLIAALLLAPAMAQDGNESPGQIFLERKNLSGLKSMEAQLLSNLQAFSLLPFDPDISAQIRTPLLEQIENSLLDLGFALGDPNPTPVTCERCFGGCLITSFFSLRRETIDGPPGTTPSECVDFICSQCQSRVGGLSCEGIVCNIRRDE